MLLDPFAFIYFFILTLNIGLGLIVYLSDKRKDSNKAFLGITLGIALWMVGSFTNISSIIGTKIAFAGASLIAGYLFWFSLYFPSCESKKPFLLKTIFWLIVSSISFICAFSNLIVEKATSADLGYVQGKLYFLFAAYFLLFASWGILNVIKKLKTVKTPIEKKQIEYFLCGILISTLTGTFTNLIFPLFFKTSQYYKIGPLASIFFVVFTFFAITRYHLFNIKLILTEILVFAIGIVLAIFPFLMPTDFLRISAIIIFFFFCIAGYLLIEYARNELKAKETLEQKVQDRTKELEQSKKIAEERAQELEKWYKLTIGREVRMAELKEKIKELEIDKKTEK
ncbi:MAG: histidine kinase N-terminal 7TM domain-containing protein [Candidatus Paceibacterota bacterium]|jgi:hypothetical protein